MDEDKTLNEGLEDNNSNNEDTSQTEEATSETEVETQQGDETGNDGDSANARKERANNQISRLKEEKRKLKEKLAYLEGLDGEESSKESNKEISSSDLDTLRMEMKGIEDKDTQAYVKKYANLEGISVTEAINSDFVQNKIAENKDKVERSRATGTSNNRTGKPREKTPQELAKEAEKGNIPDNPTARRAALKALQEKYNQT